MKKYIFSYFSFSFTLLIYSNDKSNRKKGKDKDEIKFSKSSQQRITKTNLPSSFLKKLLNFEPSNKPLSNDIVYRIINRWINSNTTVVCT